MLDNEPPVTSGTGEGHGSAVPASTPQETAQETPAPAKRARKRAAATASVDPTSEAPPRARRRRSAAAADELLPMPTETDASGISDASRDSGVKADEVTDSPVADKPANRTRSRRKAVPSPLVEPEATAETAVVPEPEPEAKPSSTGRRGGAVAATVLFMAPAVDEEEVAAAGRRTRSRRGATAEPEAVEPTAPARRGRGAAALTEPVESPVAEGADEAGGKRRRTRNRKGTEPAAVAEPVDEDTTADLDADDDDDTEEGRRRRRRGRRGRGRGKGQHDEDESGEPIAAAEPEAEDDEDDAEGDGEGLTRRRRRRRRKGAGEVDSGSDDGVHTVVKIREPRAARDEVQGVSGSTRLEAKRQRRRDGRDQRRTRPPILSESEFLARREAVDRVMVVRQKGDRTQIAVMEDGVLVEHYVTRQSSGSMAGNVYLGKVQNVLPSMEAAFVDIGRGRNAVLYAGEVNWDITGLEGRARSIEQALKSGDSVLVQVTKDPIGHKGARLTSHIALSGRHLVYVPHGNASGISRKLSDVERKRLRDVLKQLVPDGAGVIVRTAAEGADEDELARDVTRLRAQWEAIQAKVAEGGAPVLLYEEPDLIIRVVRDLFNEDFRELIIQGNDAHDMVAPYLEHVSPDLVERVHKHVGVEDVFAKYRIDEQILKGLDRKVFLPSGGHLVIDRTEAMTVVDVNTGKYTGAGGNLEETVTRNNLEAAEEIVRQLRLRDIGGIIVIDFIDMVLESNRELVLRRLTECLGRDRTKHQVTEITSLGLVQMTRKRIGQGLLEAFSENCEHCKGRGLIVHTEPVPERRGGSDNGHRESAKEPRDNGRKEKGESGHNGSARPEPLADTPLGPLASAEDPDAVPVGAESEGRRKGRRFRWRR